MTRAQVKSATDASVHMHVTTYIDGHTEDRDCAVRIECCEIDRVPHLRLSPQLLDSRSEDGIVLSFVDNPDGQWDLTESEKELSKVIRKPDCA